MRPEDSSSPWDEDSAFQGRKAAKVRRITLDLKDMTSTASPFSLNARRPVLSWRIASHTSASGSGWRTKEA